MKSFRGPLSPGGCVESPNRAVDDILLADVVKKSSELSAVSAFAITTSNPKGSLPISIQADEKAREA